MPTTTGYVDIWGKHGAAAIDHTGKASYVTGGDVLTASRYGLRSLDYVDGGESFSGTYYVRGRAIGTGNRTTYKAVWYVTATNAEVAAGVNLSAEKVKLFAFGG